MHELLTHSDNIKRLLKEVMSEVESILTLFTKDISVNPVENQIRDIDKVIEDIDLKEQIIGVSDNNEVKISKILEDEGRKKDRELKETEPNIDKEFMKALNMEKSTNEGQEEQNIEIIKRGNATIAHPSCWSNPQITDHQGR